MANIVSGAIGTQQQFGVQPKSPYEKQLITPTFGSGLSESKDLNATALANALGVVGTNIQAEAEADEKRQRNQLTLSEANRLIAGKTPEELAKADKTLLLHNANNGFDLTDNKYSMAILEQSIGEVAATSAKANYLSKNTGVPLSVEDAVKSYQEEIGATFENFKGTIKNQQAFESGFYGTHKKDLDDIAEEARKTINTEYRSKGQRAVGVKYQGLFANAANLTPAELAEKVGVLAKEGQMYCQTSAEAIAILSPAIDLLAETADSTEKLNAIKNVEFFGKGYKIGEQIPFFKHYQKIAKNVDYKVTEDISTRFKNPDGTINMESAKAYLKSLEGFKPSTSIPQFNLKISEADNLDLDNIKPELKNVLGSVGGILALNGLGDVAQFTSGYRSAEHNGYVGGVANSKHIDGNALDIYVGDLSDEKADELVARFEPYFGEALYHEADTGLHLHLGDYKGGLEDKDDGTEETASAYNPERQERIIKRLEAINSDAVKVRDDKYKAVKKGVVFGAYTAGSVAEAQAIIDNSDLDPMDKFKLSKDINAREAYKKKSTITAEDKAIIKYEESAGKKGLQADIDKKAEFDKVYNDPDDIVSDKLLKEANEASVRLTKYWDYLKANNPASEDEQATIDSEQESAERNAVPDDYEAPEDKEGKVVTAANYLATEKGLSKEEIIKAVRKEAKANGLDPASILGKIEWDKIIVQGVSD